MALLHVEHLSKAYRMGSAEVNVLRDVSLAVASGESVAIIGASGAGKSTLLHVLGGLDLPSTGRVAFKGADLYGLSERRRAYVRARQIGFVFQFYHLLPELDVLENVMFNQSAKGTQISANAAGEQVAAHLHNKIWVRGKSLPHVDTDTFEEKGLVICRNTFQTIVQLAKEE